MLYERTIWVSLTIAAHMLMPPRARRRVGRLDVLRIVALIPLLLASACRGAPQEERPVPESLEELRAALTRILGEERIPGAGIAIVDPGGVIWAGGVGFADLKHGDEVTADTHFRVGSITKSFVALGAAKLVEEGKLSLDAPLEPALGTAACTNPFEAAHPLTLAHVLEHTAGFAEDPTSREAGDDESNDAPVLPLADVLAIDPRSRAARWPPGARYDYSNVGPIVAAYAIEKATGRAWDDYLRDAIFTPLHMRTAHLRIDEEERARLAQGYVGAAQRARTFYSENYRPTGFLMTSARELANLVIMLCRRGVFEGQRILSAETIERVERGTTLRHEIPAQTYGLGNMARFSRGHIVRGHGGQMDGFLSEYGYVPELGVGWVLLLNSNHVDSTGDAWRAQSRARRLLLGYLTRDRLAPAPASALGALLVGTEPDAISPNPESLYLRASPRWPWTMHRDAFFFSSAFVLASLPLGLVRVARWRRRSGRPGIPAATLLGGPLLLAFGMALATMTMLPSALDAPIEARTLAMWLLPVAYALATSLAARATWRVFARREGRPVARAYAALLLVANATVVAYLAAMGLVGVRLWS